MKNGLYLYSVCVCARVWATRIHTSSVHDRTGRCEWEKAQRKCKKCAHVYRANEGNKMWHNTQQYILELARRWQWRGWCGALRLCESRKRRINDIDIAVACRTRWGIDEWMKKKMHQKHWWMRRRCGDVEMWAPVSFHYYFHRRFCSCRSSVVHRFESAQNVVNCTWLMWTLNASLNVKRIILLVPKQNSGK